MKMKMVVVALLVAVAANLSAQSKTSYVDRLIALAGTPYNELSCVRFIEQAHEEKGHCTAAEMFDGCRGAMVVVAEVPDMHTLPYKSLVPGDVVNFHGAHVAVYVGYGQFMDSDPLHNGVGQMVPTKDGWFAGPVRILRWKDSK